MDSNVAETVKVFWIAVVFSAVMEIFQLTTRVYGTFDVWDILVEVLAEVAAIFIIKIHFKEEIK